MFDCCRDTNAILRATRFRKTLTAAVSAVIVAACTSAPPTIDQSGEVTFDGLYPVANSKSDEAWARPGIDISQYNKILLQGAGIEFRPGGESGKTWSARSRGGPYEVTERQKEALSSIIAEAFVKALAESEHFELTNTPGPDVLLVRGKLLDVVSYVPPETTGVRDAVFISKVGEATLVLELRDSITETILARAVDRRAAEASTGIGLQESNRVRNASEVRRLAQVWARRLREQLDTYGAPNP